MNEQEIKNELLLILKKIAPDTEPETLADDEPVRETLMIDSFDFLRFITAIDARFGISTPEQDYGRTDTLKKLVAYITEKSGTK